MKKITTHTHRIETGINNEYLKLSFLQDWVLRIKALRRKRNYSLGNKEWKRSLCYWKANSLGNQVAIARPLPQLCKC